MNKQRSFHQLKNYRFRITLMPLVWLLQLHRTAKLLMEKGNLLVKFKLVISDAKEFREYLCKIVLQIIKSKHG